MNLLLSLIVAAGSVGYPAAEAQVIEVLKDILCGIGVVYFVLHISSVIVGFAKALGLGGPDKQAAAPKRLMRRVEDRVRSAPMSR